MKEERSYTLLVRKKGLTHCLSGKQLWTLGGLVLNIHNALNNNIVPVCLVVDSPRCPPLNLPRSESNEGHPVYLRVWVIPVFQHVLIVLFTDPKAELQTCVENKE